MNIEFTPNYNFKIKHMRGKNKGVATRCADVTFGFYGLKALRKTSVSNRMLSSCRKTLTNFFKRQVKVYIRIFPNQSYTKKPLGVRMGRGSGDITKWLFKLKEGNIIAELGICDIKEAKQALMSASKKLPIKCTFIKRFPTKEEFNYIQNR